MATAGQTAVLPDVPKRAVSFDERRTETRAGPVLFLGGAAFAAAYVVVGFTELSPWPALLAIAGTALTLLGLRSIVRRSA